MTTEERLVRAATRRLEPEWGELKFHCEAQTTRRRVNRVLRLMVTFWALAAIAGTAAAHKAHLLAFPASYLIATLLIILLAVLWSRNDSRS